MLLLVKCQPGHNVWIWRETTEECKYLWKENILQSYIWGSQEYTLAKRKKVLCPLGWWVWNIVFSKMSIRPESLKHYLQWVCSLLIFSCLGAVAKYRHFFQTNSVRMGEGVLAPFVWLQNKCRSRSPCVHDTCMHARTPVDRCDQPQAALQHCARPVASPAYL